MSLWRRPGFYLVLLFLFIAVVGCQMPQSCLDGDAFSGQGELEKAVDSYMSCMVETRATANSELALKVMNLKAQITKKALDDTAKLLADKKTLPLLKEAIKHLESKEKYDTSDGSISSKIKEYENIADEYQQNISRLLGNARVAREKKQWDSAVAYVLEAEVFYPKSTEIVTLKEAIISNRDSYYTRLISNECDKEDYDSAMLIWEEWIATIPSPSLTSKDTMYNKILDTKDEVVNKLVDRYRTEQKYYTAYILIKESKVRNIQKKKDFIIEAGSNYYKNFAYKKKANVEDFHAYLAAYKAHQLKPDDVEIFKLCRDCEEKVNDSLKVLIGYEAFESPSNEPVVGRQISDMLSSSLLSAMPYGFGLDSRRKLEFIKIDTDNRESAFTIQGVHFGIYGAVSKLVIEHEKNEKKRKVKVVMSNKETNNPEYQNMVRSYGYDKSTWPSVPQEILKDESYNYIENYYGEEKILGQIEVSASIYSTRFDKMEASKTFYVSKEIKDSYVEPLADAIPPIEEDPLEMPNSKFEVELEMKQEVVDLITDWFIKQFEPRQMHLAEDMKKAIESREDFLAVQYAAQGFLFCQKSNIDKEDQWYKELTQQALFDLTEGADEY